MGRLNPLGSIFSRSEKLEDSRKKHKERTNGSTYQFQQRTFLGRLKEMFFYSGKKLGGSPFPSFSFCIQYLSVFYQVVGFKHDRHLQQSSGVSAV